MAKISSGIVQEGNFLKLKAINENEIRPEVLLLLVEDEAVMAAFRTKRDQVIFTDRRVFVVNVQGITGKKVSYFSFPYSKVQYYGIETAGVLDIDSELLLSFSDGCALTFDFKSNVDIKGICHIISQYIL